MMEWLCFESVALANGKWLADGVMQEAISS